MIETKEVNLTHGQSIADLTAFGWQKTQTVSRRSGKVTHSVQIMARETTMPHYEEYCKYEKDYYAASSQMKFYNSMEFGTVILLLLLLIIPGVLYITFKTHQKNKIEANNNQCLQQMKEAVAAASNIH